MIRRSPYTRLNLNIEQPDPNAGGGTGGGAPPAKVEFTAEQHAEMNRIVQAREAEAARKAARDKQAEVDTYLAEQKAIEDRSKLDDNARLAAELADAQAKTAAAEKKATDLEAKTNTVNALLAANFDPKHIDDAFKLLGDGDQAEAIKALAEKHPTFLTAAGTGATPPPPGFTPPRTPPPGGGSSKTAAERGREALIAAGLKPRPADAA